MIKKQPTLAERLFAAHADGMMQFHRILEDIYGEKYRNLDALLSYSERNKHLAKLMHAESKKYVEEVIKESYVV